MPAKKNAAPVATTTVRATTHKEALERAGASTRPSFDAQAARDANWADAFRTRKTDRQERVEGDILTPGVRRLQQVADGEIATVLHQRDSALRTLAGISQGLAKKAQECKDNPKGRMSNKAIADMLEAFLLNPS